MDSEELRMLGKLDGSVTAMGREIGEVKRAIMGNGRPGLEERATRLEENVDEVAKALQGVAASLEQVAEKVASAERAALEVKKSIETHVADREKHEPLPMLGKNLKLLVWGSGAFVIFHTLLESANPAWRQLRDWLKLP